MLQRYLQHSVATVQHVNFEGSIYLQHFMSFFTTADFAKNYSIKQSTLRSYISRGKIVKEEGFINTDHPINKVFLIELENKSNNTVSVVEKPVAEKTKAKLPPSNEEGTFSQNIIAALSHRKKLAETLKAEKDAELKQIQIEKLLGKLLPIKEVESILIINIQNIFRTMESELENIASVYCEILGGDRTHLTRMTKEMREGLHRVITESKTKSKEEIITVIEEYAETRSRGERK